MKSAIHNASARQHSGGPSPVVDARSSPVDTGLADAIAEFTQPSMDVMLYYRSKIVAFEREREQYLSRLADMERVLMSPRAPPTSPAAAVVEVRTGCC